MNNLVAEFLKIAKFFILWFENKDLLLAKIIVKYPLINNKIFPIKNSKLYQLPELNIKISLEKHLFLIKSYSLILHLIENTNISFSIDNENEVLVDIKNIKVYVSTFEDIYILKEIFVDGIYDLNVNNTCYVIDIGMNVCIASLYFSNMKNIKKVFGYEPFYRTYKQGLKNIALNPQLKNKIETHNYGLGDDEKDLLLDYNFECKASIGITGITSGKISDDVTREEIHISDVNIIINRLYEENNDIDIVAKIDCEGSEYEIISSLAKCNNLEKIKVLMIEWHERGPDEIIKTLTTAGYVTFSLKTNNRIGMIYASK